MVSSVEPNATRAGVAILEAGGNAVDAAVATGFALAVTHPSAGNLGGGGFMLVKLRGQATRAIDFRERAPLALTQTGFQQMIAARAVGPRASGVPGSVAGLGLAHASFGRLPLPQVLAPAIALAREGHVLGERQGLVLGWTWPSLKRDPAARRVFGKGDRPLKTGERLLQPALATTLERIARQGERGFYTGPSALALTEYMQRHSGWIDERDLAEYRAVFREPLRIRYRGYDVEVMPPPSAGGVAVVQMLAMLQASHAERFAVGSAEGLHWFAEIAKRAHAERRFHVGDPDTTSAATAAAQRHERWTDPMLWLGPFPIAGDRATPASSLHPLYAAAMRELDQTTHFSVVDAEGNAVSCTTTLSGGFGARYLIGDLGVVMNNSVAAFGTVGENLPQPGRRMTSSMSPALIFREDELVLVLGSPGGDTIPNTVVQVLQNLIDGQMTLDDAIDAPRIHHGFVPDAIRSERLRPPPTEVRRALERLGHAFTPAQRTIGDANAVLLDGRDLYGYSDRREGGLALGPSAAPARRE